jgi:hypothetical protein
VLDPESAYPSSSSSSSNNSYLEPSGDLGINQSDVSLIQRFDAYIHGSDMQDNSETQGETESELQDLMNPSNQGPRAPLFPTLIHG